MLKDAVCLLHNCKLHSPTVASEGQSGRDAVSYRSPIRIPRYAYGTAKRSAALPDEVS